MNENEQLYFKRVPKSNVANSFGGMVRDILIYRWGIGRIVLKPNDASQIAFLIGVADTLKQIGTHEEDVQRINNIIETLDNGDNVEFWVGT